MEEKRKKAYRAGVIILVLLGVLTAVEYVVGLLGGNLWLPLIAIALVKAFLVLRDYMHVSKLFSSEEEAHS